MMKKCLVYPFLIILTQLSYAQEDLFSQKEFASFWFEYASVDTTSATIPVDYWGHCECTGVFDIAAHYTFDDIHRTAFSPKKVAKYILCSLVDLDSVRGCPNDTALYVIHAKVLSYGVFYSPYYLNYWTPSEDALETEFLSGSTAIYNEIQSNIKSEETRCPCTLPVNIVVHPHEVVIFKNAMNDLQDNLFLLHVNGEDCLFAYQFFTKGGFDISLLYTPLQYYKYQRDRYLNYLHNVSGVLNK